MCVVNHCSQSAKFTFVRLSSFPIAIAFRSSHQRLLYSLGLFFCIFHGNGMSGILSPPKLIRHSRITWAPATITNVMRTSALLFRTHKPIISKTFCVHYEFIVLQSRRFIGAAIRLQWTKFYSNSRRVSDRRESEWGFCVLVNWRTFCSLTTNTKCIRKPQAINIQICNTDRLHIAPKEKIRTNWRTNKKANAKCDAFHLIKLRFIRWNMESTTLQYTYFTRTFERLGGCCSWRKPNRI